MTACMFALRIVFGGAPTLPELFQDQVIALVPGSVFGFVLDQLQFAAKPLLLVGLALLGVPLGSLMGWLFGTAWPLHGWLGRGSLAGGAAYGLVVWLALALAIAVSGDGIAGAITSSGSLLPSAELYAIGLVGIARVLERPASRGLDQGRRAILLSGLTGGALVIAGGALARMLAANSEQQSALEPALTEASAAPTPDALNRPSAEPLTIPPGVTDEITPNERFYIVSKNFNDPRVSPDKWSLEVFGLLARPLRFSYAEILAMPTTSQYTTLECISNALGGNLMSNAYWTGVPLSNLLSSVGVQQEARAVIFRSADNYYESFPLEVALAPGVLLAHSMNGLPLPDKHGFPLRLILPGRYGVKNPKWITKIELAAEPIEGYWVRRGWDAEALVQAVARIDIPKDNTSITGPGLEIGGVAFAGSRAISRVEASVDGGTTWRDARFRPALGSSTWLQWATSWEDVAPGTYTIMARATDGTGAVQTAEENGSFPRGATGYQRARIDLIPATG